ITYQVRNLDRVRQDWLERQVRLEKLTVTHAEYLQQSLDLPLFHPDVYVIVQKKRRGLATASVGTPVNPLAPPPPQFSNAPQLKAWQIALIVTPFALYALWLLWSWLRRHALLQRLPDKKLPQLHDLKVEGIEHKLFASPRVRRLLLGLRRPRPLPVRELNVPATVRATIRQRGLFTPPYRKPP